MLKPSSAPMAATGMMVVLKRAATGAKSAETLESGLLGEGEP